MPSALIRFLHRAIHVALNPRSNPLTFVFGNEGGDIDSVVSAIYVALLLSPSWDQPTHIPVLNFPRADLPLRCDILTMLRDHGISAEDLIFEDQLHGTDLTAVPSDAVFRNEKDGTIILDEDTVYLTDHNVLRASQSHWASRVIGIIDHHSDEKKYSGTIKCDLSRIELIGSATSLVALAWKARNAVATVGRPIPSPLLLMAPIVADTGNFRSSKNTPVDEEAGDFIREQVAAAIRATKEAASGEKKAIEEIVGVKQEANELIAAVAEMTSKTTVVGGAATAILAERLKTLKEYIRNLTVPETLRRDYKRFALAGGFNVGISAILLTKKQTRKLYAVRRSDPNDPTSVPEGAKSDDDDEKASDAKEDDDENSTTGGYSSDAIDFLPAIASRMESQNLNVYMNMYNKKGRELEVIYRSADAETFEPLWNYFLAQTAETVNLEPKKKFKLSGGAFEYKNILVSGSPIKQIVYRQHQTKVSRKNFTPYLVTHFANFVDEKQRSEMKADL